MSRKPYKTSEVASEILSPKKKPTKMSLVEWQFALRRQFGQDNAFDVKNLGVQEVYSDFDVFNHSTERHYKVAIRSQDNSLNFCTCNDFKTNGLSTCKHIEYVLYQIKKYPPYHKILLEGYQPDYSSIYLKYGAVREVMIKIGAQEKGKFQALAKKYFNKDFTLKEASVPLIHELIKEAKLISNNFRVYDDAMEYLLERRAAAHRQEKAAQLFTGGLPEHIEQKLFKNSIPEHYKQGALFLLKAGRALVADDLAISRFLQSLVASEILASEFGVRKILVICPSSLREQWVCKIQQETYSEAKIYSGSRDIGEIPKHKKLYTIVSYQTLCDEMGVFQNMKPDLVIIDEVHRLKNWQPRIAEQVKRIKSKYVFVLAVPIIATEVEELYGVMQFIDIFKLGPRYQFMADHLMTDVEGATTGAKNLHEIPRLLKDVMLRRTQKQVATQTNLVDEECIWMPLTQAQERLHRYHLISLKKLVALWQNNQHLNEGDRQQLLIDLHSMCMVSSNVFIIDQQTRSGTKISELMFLLERAKSLVPHKIVVYTQWERMARLVTQYLKEKNIEFLYLKPDLAAYDKEKIMAQYANPKVNSILLVTDDAIEVLELGATQIIINLDLPMSPQSMAERITKANRDLQPIHVFNFVSTPSVEHKLWEIYHKKSTAQGLLSEGDNVIFLPGEHFDQYMKVIEKLADIDTDHVFERSIYKEEEAKEDRKNKATADAAQLSFFDVGEQPVKVAPSRMKGLPKPDTSLPLETIDNANGLDLETIKQYLHKDSLTGEVYLKIPLYGLKKLDELSGYISSLQQKIC